MSDFSSSEWQRIARVNPDRFGLPRRRRKSIVVGSFNIRKLGRVTKRSPQAWDFLRTIVRRYDLLAIQEVQADLAGIRHLKELAGSRYELVVSDPTGRYPGKSGASERLCFLFRRDRVQRTEVASDITYDRDRIVEVLYEYQRDFVDAFDHQRRQLRAWERRAAAARAKGKRLRGRPTTKLPHFLTFIRQPLCVSFRIGSAAAQNPYELLAVNAHLLYGAHPAERRLEFYALMSWLVDRARHLRRMYHPNMLLLADCNLDFREPEKERPIIEAFIKSLNKSKLRSRTAAKLNFPFLDVHPARTEVFRTNARLGETYDQIGLVLTDKRLPDYRQNAVAGTVRDGYDYGVFNFTEMFAQALHGVSFQELRKRDQRALVRKYEYDLSDHLPIWLRLARPS